MACVLVNCRQLVLESTCGIPVTSGLPARGFTPGFNNWCPSPKWGGGTHHQTISSWARTMLLHATIHWPEQQHLNLWPYAFEHAVFLWNNLPGRTSGVAPLELFTGVTLTSSAHLHRSHVWGCPAYVLDPKLQDGKKLPKWQSRGRQGQYLGVSPDHSSTIGRILNLRSSFISPNIMLSMTTSFLRSPMLNLVARSSLNSTAPFGAS